MKYVGKLLIISQVDEYKFTTFAQQLDELYVTPEVKRTLKLCLFDFDIQSQSLVDWIDTSIELDTSNDSSRFEWMAATIIYKQLSDTFIRFGEHIPIESALTSASYESRAYEFTCQTLEALLKCSSATRKLADEENFLLCIIEQMIQIFDAVRGSFSEFARQHGNAKVGKIYWIFCMQQ